MDWAAIVTSVLKIHQMSEADLAKKIGITQPTIHRLKTGEIVEPRYSTGSKLLKLLTE